MSESPHQDSQYQLQCMDIWSGNRFVENQVSTPGLDVYVYSQPYHGEGRGGDVHYLSLCAGGVATRFILADVAGHGDVVAGTSQTLRQLMRRFMNHKSQTRLVRELNREFTQMNQTGRFATAVVATYLSSSDRIAICNAGHPQPLLYQQSTKAWSFAGQELIETGAAYNLPLGIYEETAYQQLSLKLQEGDVLIFYTDAVTEAFGADGQILGEKGLLELIKSLPCNDVREIGQGILSLLKQYSGDRPCDDDLTLMVVRYSRSAKRFPGALERINGYAKVLGLKAT
jgi:sigma-B regulation protein RsbU (phosphoserine phosphatase)